jgi:SRP72 RNA-binding domain
VARCRALATWLQALRYRLLSSACLSCTWECRPTGGAALPQADGDGALGDGRQRKRKNRKRKPRYPKGFDPENPGPLPDTERWLPKQERSDFKRRRKGKKQQPVSKGAQVRATAASPLARVWCR